MTALGGLAGLALGTAAMAALCLAYSKHFEQTWQRPPKPVEVTALRVFGCLGLAASAWACVQARGAGVGSVLFFAVITLGGLAVSGVQTYRSRWLPRFAYAALALFAGVTLLPR